jgi:cytochrome c biogenesis protein CcmG/thiol:disulfide interchange protein DsbE
VHRQFGDRINVLGVFFERDRGKVRDEVKKKGWTFPIVVDQDGVLTNLYAVGGCPTTVFADRGGRVRLTRVGDIDQRRLTQLVQGLR